MAKSDFAFRHDQPESLETEAERELRKRGFDPKKLRRPGLSAQKQNQQNAPSK